MTYDESKKRADRAAIIIADGGDVSLVIDNAIRSAVYAEREACAKIAEEAEPFDKWDGGTFSHAKEEIAKLIRSRGDS